MAAPQNFVSVSRRQLDLEDYIDIMRRHRSWIVGPTWAGLVISVVIALFWPSTYESSAFMKITPQLVSEQMVPDVVQSATGQRLQSLKNDVLSRGSLSALIRNMKLYPKIVADYSIEDAVEQMTKDIDVRADIQVGGGQRFATSVRVLFAYPDRYKARDVVQALAAAFVDANSTFQTTSAKRTASFISQQLKEAQDKLEALNASIADFRIANQGKLPDQAASNGQQLSILQNQFAQVNDRINSLELQKNSYETALQGREDILSLIARAPDPASATQAVGNQKLIALDAAIRAQQMELATLKEKYQSDWPAVKEAEARLKVLNDEQTKEQALQDEQQTAATERKQAQQQNQKKGTDLEREARLQIETNNIESFRTQIANNNRQIQQLTKERAEVNGKIEELQAKIQASPTIEQQYTALTRDLGLARDRYDTLKKEDDLSQTAKDLQGAGWGETLELLDPANLPINPSKPNRWAIAGGGTVAGLLLGFMLAGAKEAKDTSLKNLKDVRAYSNLPVLSSIPLLENALLVRRKRRLLWLGWSTAVMMGIFAMGVSLWFYYAGNAR
jgi:succinoglycan biosynthesis transport protein ExoP